MSAEVTDRRERNRYEITEDGEVAGFLTYRLTRDLIELVHTEVEADYEGHGLAGILVRAVLDDARARGLGVIPRCPYVAKFIDRHRGEYLHLVPEDRRAQFHLDG